MLRMLWLLPVLLTVWRPILVDACGFGCFDRFKFDYIDEFACDFVQRNEKAPTNLVDLVLPENCAGWHFLDRCGTAAVTLRVADLSISS
jgi:hypothetical protein